MLIIRGVLQRSVSFSSNHKTSGLGHLFSIQKINNCKFISCNLQTVHFTKRKCNLLKLSTDMKWVFSSAGSCASLLTRVVKRNLIWQSVLCIRLVNDEKQTYFYTSLWYQFWRSHSYLLSDFICLCCFKIPSESRIQNWILKQTCQSRRKRRAETKAARYETFFHAARCRCPWSWRWISAPPTATASLTLTGHQGRRWRQHFVGFSVNFI